MAFLPSLIVFLITYFFIATEKMDKTIAAILGAAVVISTHQIPYLTALEKIDLNVIFVLIGMMIVVNILATTGMFEWVAILLAQKAKGHGLKLLLAMCLVTAGLSAVLDNVTTIIIIAPVTILISQLLELPTAPFLILQALFSNIGGTATLIGDPPNILIGSQSHLNFTDFIEHLAPITLIILACVLVLCTFLFRKSFHVEQHVRNRLDLADARAAIIHPRRLKVALPVLCLIFVGFFVGHLIHVETGLVALAGAFLMCLVSKEDVHHALAKVEWSTILFFIGLFMLVGALEENGLFELLGHKMVAMTGGNLLYTAIAVLWFSAIFSAFLDNIPLVISTIPILKSIIPVFAQAAGLDPESPEALTQIAEPLYWALALGACLGGNGTLIGASANVVIAQIARRNQCTLSFGHFFKYGFPIMLLSVTISTGYVYLRYFAFR